MPTFPCIVLPAAASDGPGNMARDEAMLEYAAGHPDSALLRLYTWDAATLSLGYFQPVAAATTDPRWRDVPLVRRPTGGGAILHDAELTYALALPRSHPLARHSVGLYRAVHAAIASLLAELGVAAQPRGPINVEPASRKPFLCFLDRDPEDIVVGPHKVVGSAQRRRAGTILQHGSLLLARSPLAPELPGVADLSPLGPNAADWLDPVRIRILDALGLFDLQAPEPGTIAVRSMEIARSVYGDPHWTHRR